MNEAEKPGSPDRVHASPSRGRMITAPIRRLPQFIIAGAQKCGTTSLYAYLRRHPSIERALRKEVHYFDLNFDKGLRWYRAHFPTVFKSFGRKMATGEACPYYLFHPLAATRAYATVPHAVVVILLRNPVDRAYSHYHHQVRNGNETLSFEEALEKEAERLDGEETKILTDPSCYSFNHRKFSYQARGLYADQVERWMRLYPPEKLLIESSEDFYADPRTLLSRIFLALDLPDPEIQGFKKYLKGGYDRLDPGVRRRLAEYFRPHNQRLYDLVGRDFGWE
jgi:hypothetical protein